MWFIGVGIDPVRMFFDQFSKNKPLEHGKDKYGQQIIRHSKIRRVGHQADAKDIKSRRTPHQTGEEQQGIALYFYNLPPF